MRPRVSGIVLAGGQGRRMGSVDKGLQNLRGRPLVAWVIERFRPQVDELMISANRNLDHYASFAARVLPDDTTGFAGPLAGLERAMSAVTDGLVATVPCDSPFLPGDLVTRLYTHLANSSAEVAIARTANQVHPVFCLCRAVLHEHLRAYLARGERSFHGWYADLRVAEVSFDDEAEAFQNINTLSELNQHESTGSPAS